MMALDGLSEGRFHATSPKKQEFSIWLDVLHRLMDIERQAGPRPAQHVVVLAKRRGLIDESKHAELKSQLEEISRMPSGLINGLENRGK